MLQKENRIISVVSPRFVNEMLSFVVVVFGFFDFFFLILNVSKSPCHYDTPSFSEEGPR